MEEKIIIRGNKREWPYFESTNDVKCMFLSFNIFIKNDVLWRSIGSSWHGVINRCLVVNIRHKAPAILGIFFTLQGAFVIIIRSSA